MPGWLLDWQGWLGPLTLHLMRTPGKRTSYVDPQANMSKVTNKSGFLMGIIRRVENEVPGKGPTLHDLPRFVRRKLEDLLADKRIRTLPYLTLPSP